jgi:hypothetical protein
VSADINLSGSLPSSLAKAAITIKGQSSSGDKLLCMEVDTVPEAEEQKPEPEPVKEEFVQGGNLKLNWKDCGDSSTHGKISGFSPSSLTLGQKTTVTGTGSVDQGISGGTFDIAVKAGIISKSLNGDLCAPKTFDLPLGVGSVSWDGLKCPVAAGATSVSADINLSGSLPSSLAKAAITIKGQSSSGDKLLCMEVDTVPEAEEATIIV